MVGAVSAVGLLRLVGFASTVFGANAPWMLVLQYIAMSFAIGGGLYVVQTGVILEPPAFLMNWVNALTERLTRRLATP